jgi:hypothetical protein
MTIALRDGVTRVSDITSAVGDSRLDWDDWNIAAWKRYSWKPQNFGKMSA